MSYLPREHPVRELLEQAAFGRLPTRAQLDKLDGFRDLPDGQSLASYRESINRHAREVAAVAETGNHHAARQRAEAAWTRLADRMSPEQASVTGDPDPEPLADVTARMFGPH